MPEVVRVENYRKLPAGSVVDVAGVPHTVFECGTCPDGESGAIMHNGIICHELTYYQEVIED